MAETSATSPETGEEPGREPCEEPGDEPGDQPDDEAPDKAGERVCVGQITGVRGLKGEVCVRSFTADPEAIAGYGPLVDESGTRALRLRIVGHRKDALIVRVDGVGDRTAAEALNGIRLYVDRTVLPPPDEDEYYHADLIGLAAELVLEGGGPARPLGRVASVHDFGAGPVLELAVEGATPLLVPFSRAAVPEVDLRRGRLLVSALPGLIWPVDQPEDGQARNRQGKHSSGKRPLDDASDAGGSE